MSFLLGIDPGLRSVREQTVDVFTAGGAFTAGSSTTVTLTADPGTENAVIISFDGIVQHHDTFSQSGTTITFDAAIPTGVAKVEAVYVASVLSYQRVQDAGVTTAKLGGDAVTSAKIADDQIDSEHYVDGSIDLAHMSANSIDSDQYVDGSIDTVHIAAAQVTGPKLGGGVIPASTGFAGTDYDLGTNTTGTETLDYTNGNFQYGVNGGAHTLAPQTVTSTIIVQYTNDASAGTLTTSGFTIVTGDSLTTDNGDDFMIYSTVLNSFKHLHVVALQ